MATETFLDNKNTHTDQIKLTSKLCPVRKEHSGMSYLYQKNVCFKV